MGPLPNNLLSLLQSGTGAPLKSTAPVTGQPLETLEEGDAGGLFAILLTEIDLELQPPPTESLPLELTVGQLPQVDEVLPHTGNLLPLPVLVEPVTDAPSTELLEADPLIPATLAAHRRWPPVSLRSGPIHIINAGSTSTGSGSQPVPPAALAKEPLASVSLATPHADTSATSAASPMSVTSPTTEDLVAPFAVSREPAAALSPPATGTGQPAANMATGASVIAPATPLINPAPAAPNAPVPALAVDAPVQQPQWAENLGSRLMWMNNQGIGRAELRLNPPELGPVDVRITVVNDEARVAFNTHHATTREALETALPRLREMFSSQGLNLADASVSHHSAGGDNRHADRTPERHAETQLTDGGGDDELDADDAMAAGAVVTRGLIDTYA